MSVDELKILGIRADIVSPYGLHSISAVANELVSEFSELAQTMPALSLVFAALQHAAEPPAASGGDRIRWFESGKRTQNYAEFLRFALEFRPKSEMSAACARACRALGWALPAWAIGVARFDLLNHDLTARWIPYVVEHACDAHELDLVLQGGLIAGNAPAWLQALAKKAALIFPDPAGKSEHTQPARVFCESLTVGVFSQAMQDEQKDSLAGSPLPGATKQDENEEEEEEDRKRAWGNQPATSLDERHLMPEHWFAPTQAETAALTRILRHGRNTNGQLRDAYFERLIVMLAFAMGKTFKQVLALPVISSECRTKPKEDYLYIAAHDWSHTRRSGRSWSLTWVRPHISGIKGHQTQELHLQFPKFLVNELRHYLTPCQISTSCIEDFLPWSCMPWPERVLLQFTRATKMSSSRGLLLARHSLARSMYAKTASRALLHFLFAEQTEESTLNGQVSATHHYINPHGPRTIATFLRGLSEVFSLTAGLDKQLSELTPNRYVPELDSEALHRFQLRQRQPLERAIKSGDALAIHNAMARYTLGMLIFSTGHRLSLTPFFFPWDLLLDEQLVFIADKKVVGSEARAIALTPCVVGQIKAYRHHLRGLAAHLRSTNPRLAEQIDRIAIGRDIDETNDGKSCIGQFFEIEQSGQIRTLTTHDIAMHGQHDKGKKGAIDTRALRRAIADHLWNQGFSEPHIHALLGHNHAMHTYGSSSTWTVVEVADRLRPALTSYVDGAGWSIVSSPLAQYATGGAKPYTPGLNTSIGGYEGRERNHLQARARAEQVLKSILPSEWFTDAGSVTLLEDDVQKMHAQVSSTLAHDRASHDKVDAVLRDVISTIRKRGGTVEWQTLSLERAEPSPIDLTFARNFAVAKEIRAAWPAIVLTPIASTSKGLPIRLARLAMSMVLHDAVLDPARIRAALQELCTSEPRIKDGQPFVRTSIQTTSHHYEIVLVLSESTAALAHGLSQHVAGSSSSASIEATDIFSGALKEALGRYVPAMVNAMSSLNQVQWTLEKLCHVFQAWWFIRVPGFLYHGMCGLRPCAGPDAASLDACLQLQAVHSAHHAVPQWTAPSAAFGKLTLDAQQKRANAQLDRLLKHVAGKFSNLDASSTQQRRRLLDELDKVFDGTGASLQVELTTLANRQSVIEYLVGFLSYLIEVGGPVQSKLRFKSIRTYWGHIKKGLISLAWNKDLASLDTQELDDLYQSLIKTRTEKELTNDGRFVLQLFQQFLATKHDAAVSRVARAGIRGRRGMRGALLTDAALTQAQNIVLDAPGVTDELRVAARDLLSLTFAYGLRRGEAIGQRSSYFDGATPYRMQVVRNRARLLKTRSARRVLPIPLASERTRKHISVLVGPNGPDFKRPTTFLFKDRAHKPDRLLDDNVLTSLAITSLRAAAGYRSPVLHSARPTFVTRAVLCTCTPCVALSATQTVRRSILGADDALWRSDLANLALQPADWPHWIDRIEAWIGHAGQQSFAAYWRGDFVLLAEYTAKANEGMCLTIEQLINMTGLSYGTLWNKNNALQASRPAPNTFDGKAVVRALMQEKQKATGYVDLPPEASEAHNIKPEKPHVLDAVEMDKLLLHRRNYQLSIAELKAHALQWTECQEPAVQAFLDGYVELLTKTGFDDFEPELSELLHSPPQHSNGLVRATEERQRGLRLATDYLLTAPERDNIFLILQEWIDFVSPEDNCWIVSSIDHALTAIKFVQALDPKVKIEVTSVGWPVAEVASKLGLPVKSIASSNRRLSRGPVGLKVTELGLRVKQRAGSLIGDHRDFQRMMFVLVLAYMTGQRQQVA